MKYPKLKQALLCRILTYVVVIGGFYLPFLVSCFLDFVPDAGRVLLFLAATLALVVYIARNASVLMCMDMLLASLRCHSTARTRYDLPSSRSLQRMEAAIAHYGKKYAPLPLMPQPTDLRYRFKSSITVYTQGTEVVVAAYPVDTLDADTYRAVFSSAKANSKALTGTKKPRFLEPAQKKAPLNRVTVIVIFAQKIDSHLRSQLYPLVCRQCGDDYTESIVPCVIDLESRSCVFNSLRVPYVGYAYAVKNRGIRLVKRLIFGGRIRLRGNDAFLEPLRDVNPEESLWGLWKMLRYELILKDRQVKKRFETMADREILFENNTLYMKWGQKGICQSVELDPETNTARVESVSNWAYPKVTPIAKKTVREMECEITDHFRRRGFFVEYFDVELVM